MNQSLTQSSDDRPIEFQRYVVVRFRNEVNLPSGSFKYEAISRQLQPGARPLSNRFEFTPHLVTEIPPRLKERLERTRERNPGYEPPNLLNYSRIEVDDDAEGEEVAAILRHWDIVKYAYLHPGPEKPPMATPAPMISQAFLENAPEGIDAVFAHTEVGGRGEGICVADVEQGWNQAHADLVGHNFTSLSPGFYKEQGHGTSVLGIIAARENDQQCLGIAPELDRIITVGQWQSVDDYFTDAAIEMAWEAVDAGDVILVEAQSRKFGGLIPLEAEQAVYDMVELACNSDIIVVAAAGNGTRNLDQVADDEKNPLFKRDSGAIIVAAGKRDDAGDWLRWDGSNFGTRINCFAQGAEVATLFSDDWGYQTGVRFDFGGTSAAAAIVAGAVLSMQGIALEVLKRRLTPTEVRGLLTDKDLNTPHSGATDDIGLMPNLKLIIKKINIMATEFGGA